MAGKFDITKLPPHVLAMRRAAQQITAPRQPAKDHALAVRIAVMSRSIAFGATNWKQAGPLGTFALAYYSGVFVEPSPWYTRERRCFTVAEQAVQDVQRYLFSVWTGPLTRFPNNEVHMSLACMESEHEQKAVANTLVTLYFKPADERIAIMKETTTVPKDIMDKLQMNLASLEQALLNKDAMMPQHLRNSHALLIQYPETVHLLDDSEVALLIDAAEVHTKTEIVKAAATKSSRGKTAKVSASDL